LASILLPFLIVLAKLGKIIFKDTNIITNTHIPSTHSSGTTIKRNYCYSYFFLFPSTPLKLTLTKNQLIIQNILVINNLYPKQLGNVDKYGANGRNKGDNDG